MKKAIPLADAEIGMILARVVTNEKGMILCAEGTPVTERLISLLKQRAVTTISIVSDEEDMSEDDYLTLKDKIEKRFAAAGDSDSLLGKLKIAVLERLKDKKG